MRRVAAAAAVTAALVAPTAADASTKYVNPSSVSGAYAIKSGSTIQRFEIYCAGKGTTQTSFSNEFAFSLRDVVHIGHKGKFSYSGYAFRYGNEHQPLGEQKVKLSGRVTSKTLKVKWTSLPGCTDGSTTAARQ
jgi:opacity protein-like surface antigen